MSTRVDYEVLTAAGALIATSDDRRKATKITSDKRDQFPGVHVVEVIRSEQRRPVWTDRKHLRVVA